MAQIFLTCLCLLLVIAAVNDLRSYTIPNWLSIAILVLFAIQTAVIPVAVSALIVHIVTAIVVFALGTLLFIRGAFGGGDVKLLSSLTLWVGLIDLPRLVLTMAFAGGALALIIIFVRWFYRSNGQGIDRRVPYGIAIALAGIDFCFRQAHFTFW